MTGSIAESISRASTDRHGVAYRVVGRHSLVAGVGTDHEPPAARELDVLLDPSRIDEVILAGQAGRDQSILDLLDVCRRRGIPVRLAPTTAQLLSHSVRAVPAPGLPLFELRPPVLSGIAFLGKRVFDLVVGALLIVLLSPLMLLVALAIWLDDRGPILYRNRRMGVEEHPFDCVKFRSMRVGADQLQAGLEHMNQADGALFKIGDDPRVTRVGRVLRRFSIDELPQLFNVIRGEMSLVGPRPHAVAHDVHYARVIENYEIRQHVKPGITGWAQVNGLRGETAERELMRRRVAHDIWYAKNASIMLDIRILLLTAIEVFRQRNAH